MIINCPSIGRNISIKTAMPWTNRAQAEFALVHTTQDLKARVKEVTLQLRNLMFYSYLQEMALLLLAHTIYRLVYPTTRTLHLGSTPHKQPAADSP